MTDLLLNEEERMLQATVRDFADRELAPHAASMMNGRSSLGTRGRGWLPWVSPASGSTLAWRQRWRLPSDGHRRGRGGPGDAAASVSLVAHMSLAIQTIYQFGDEDQKLRFVPAMASGEAVGAWALTEPGGGSDAASLQTTAELRVIPTT